MSINIIRSCHWAKISIFFFFVIFIWQCLYYDKLTFPNQTRLANYLWTNKHNSILWYGHKIFTGGSNQSINYHIKHKQNNSCYQPTVYICTWIQIRITHVCDKNNAVLYKKVKLYFKIHLIVRTTSDWQYLWNRWIC